ncbi:MAG: AAA family ATPase [Planctomycetota bacterium]
MPKVRRIQPTTKSARRQKLASRADSTPEKLLPLINEGVEFSRRGTDQWCGDCPFCDKEKHFYANPRTGQWDCKSCGESGNAITFTRKIAGQQAGDMTETDWRRLARSRKLSTPWLKRFGFGNRADGGYTLAIRGEDGQVASLRWFKARDGRLMHPKGGKVALFNTEALAKAKPGMEVWICEGEWDAIALSGWLQQQKIRHVAVVAVPGAGVWKDNWTKLFAGMKVKLCFDHDAAGYTGQNKVAQKLIGVARSVEVVQWPEKYESGRDVRDFIVWALENNANQRQALDKLRSFFQPAVDVVEVEPSRFAATLLGDIETRERPPVQLEPYWPKGALVILYGAPGCGKTFVLLWLLAQIHTGNSILGGEVAAGPVLLVMAEGSGGLGKRVVAVRRGMDLDIRDAHAIEAAPNLLLDKDRIELMRATLLVQPVVIAIDTLARVTAGGDENNAKDMSLAVEAADQLRHELGATVVLVHHSTKANSKVERGSSALRGAADVMIHVSKSGDYVTLHCEKSKDTEPFRDLTLRMNVVEVDDEGNTSVWLEPVEDQDIPKGHPQRTIAEGNRLRVHKRIEFAGPNGIGSTDLVKKTGLARSTVTACIRRLLDDKKILKRREGQRVYYCIS